MLLVPPRARRNNKGGTRRVSQNGFFVILRLGPAGHANNIMEPRGAQKILKTGRIGKYGSKHLSCPVINQRPCQLSGFTFGHVSPCHRFRPCMSKTVLLPGDMAVLTHLTKLLECRQPSSGLPKACMDAVRAQPCISKSNAPGCRAGCVDASDQAVGVQATILGTSQSLHGCCQGSDHT